MIQQQPQQLQQQQKQTQQPVISSKNGKIIQYEPEPDLNQMSQELYGVKIQSKDGSIVLFDENQINMKTLLFFKMGRNMQFSDDILIFDKVVKDGFIFHPKGEPQTKICRNLKIDPELQNIMLGDIYRNYISQLGRFIIWQHKWGFAMNLDSCGNQIAGEINDFWKVILKIPFMVDLIRRYAYFILDRDEGELTSEIPNSFDEPLENIFQSKIQLFPHQMQEVNWMVRSEKCPYLTFIQDHEYVPFLDTGLFFDPSKPTKFITRNELKSSKLECHGGVLASQIGSGKTASVIQLITLTYAKGLKTLVVVPNAILYQWREEFKKFSDLNIQMIEDLKTNPDPNIDIYLVTRQVIGSIYHLYQKIKFHRVIFDEFHELTESKDQAVLVASKNIQRHFTWGMTGTPQNMNFRSKNTQFIRYLQLPKQFSSMNLQVKIMEQFVQNFMRMNPCPKNIPKLQKELTNCRFQQYQQLVYQAHMNACDYESAMELCSHMKEQFIIKNDAQDNSLQMAIAKITQKMNNEVQMLQQKIQNSNDNPQRARMLERIKSLQSQDNFYQEVIGQISQKTFECPLCLEEINTIDIVVPDCFHQVCLDCFNRMKKELAYFNCAICKDVIKDQQLIIHPKMRQNFPSKMELMLDEIDKVPKKEKIIIFTQFDDLMDHICSLFEQLDIEYIRLIGEPGEMNISLNKFKEQQNIRIIVMSVQQAASGINITEANHVFFAHPLFGFSNERTSLTYSQCIGRAHRLGQTKQVVARLFYTLYSMEENQVVKFLQS